MRIAPLAFCLDPNRAEDRQLIRDVSRITHHSEEAYAGALAVALAINAASDRTWNGDSKLLSLVASSLPDSKTRDRCVAIDQIGNDVSIAEIGKRFGTSGYVVDSVPLSLLAAQKVRTLGFEEIMCQLISLGGDTDTIGSICGQAMGTLIGVKQLPKHLITQLDDSVFIESIANQFAQTVAKARQVS
jgi:ADP-ribosylglycohydrolase